MEKTKKLLSLLLSAVMLFSILGGTVTSYADTKTNVTVSVKYEQTMARSLLSMLNDFRTGKDAWYIAENNKDKVYCNNLNKLQYDYDLEKIAMQRAAELALTVNHVRADGSAWNTAYDDFKLYDNYQPTAEEQKEIKDGKFSITNGENVAAGNNTVEAVHSAWREDDKKYVDQGHRRNMLNSQFKYVGIACVEVNGVLYWVEEFSNVSTNLTKTAAVDTTKNVTVKVADSMVKSCTLSYTSKSITLVSGKSATLPTATAQLVLDGYWNPLASSVKVTPTLSYKSSNANIASVSGNTVTAKTPGNTTVKASLFGKTISVPVTSTLNPTTIKAVSAVANGFKITWNKVAETTGYQIQYSTKSDFSNAATVYGGATNTLSKTITGRAAGTKYYVRVRTYRTFADGSRVWGAWTAAKAVTTPAKPKNTTLSSVTSTVNGFKVNWTKVSDTTGYQIQYATKSDFSGAATVYGGATNATSYTVTGRAAGTKYYVRVRTYKTLADGSRVWGNWTSAKTVTTKVSTANTKSVSGVSNGFKVTWDKIGGITGYQVQYSTRSDFKNAATVYAGNSSATTKTITGRAKNTTYYVRVRAYKNNGSSYVYGAWSSAKNVKTK